MPSGLGRGGKYGWSYALGKGQRTKSEEFLDNFDKINWDKTDDSEYHPVHVGGEGYASGTRMVKVFK